jgi:tetratricopeptide (TPR) repeat protein
MLYAFHQRAEMGQALTEALAIYRSLGDAYDIGIILIELPTASIGITDEYVEAVALCQEGIALLRQAGDGGGLAHGLNVLGELARNHGENDLAESAYEECLVVAQEIGDKLREGFMYGNLGAIALNRNDYAQARHRLKQAGTLAAEIGNKWFILDNLAWLACAIGGDGQPRRAARLMGASDALHSSMEVALEASDLPEYERGVAMVREQLGEETFNTLQKEGSVMSLDEAVALAWKEADDE